MAKTIVPSKINSQEISETKFLIDQVSRLRDDFQKIRYDLKNNFSTNQSLKPSSNLIKKVSTYMADILTRQGGVSMSDLLEMTKDNFKTEHPEMDDVQIKKLVSKVFHEPDWS